MKLIAAITLGLIVAGCDQAYADGYGYGSNDVTPVAGHSVLTDANGMTLYTFDRDQAGTSNCYDSCAESWPPYLVERGASAPGKGFTVVERRDGTRQWAKNGAPLYLWVGDRQPGDTTGDGVGGVWHIAR
ncbi:hypothetical protein [Pseudaestuariivita rosea]|uniref:COG4315 family predicted lipoprotein n=1 Tax=Pseudaestuariivita rosea TaxID=2763263 RepID=UPI001ABBBD3A|nr:hypothetical protein [Pseudaestuariivita rosea]